MKKDCKLVSVVPRSLRCCKDIMYQIVDDKGEKVLGEIINKVEGCFNSICKYLDKYDIDLPKDSNDKEKILLLNALIYLDIVKHSIL